MSSPKDALPERVAERNQLRESAMHEGDKEVDKLVDLPSSELIV